MAKKQKPKPLTEITLTDLQTRYLDTRDEDIWREMFSIMVDYARSFVLKSTKGKVFLEPDHVLGVATDAAIKVMKRYHNDPDFLIEKSFGGLLRWKVIESLYGDYQEDNHLSLNHIVSSEGGHITELGDLQESANFSNTSNPSYAPDTGIVDKFDLQKVINNVLEEFDDAVDNYRLSFICRLYVLLNIRKSKIRNNKDIFKRYLDLPPKQNEALELLLLEIRNRMISH